MSEANDKPDSRSCEDLFEGVFQSTRTHLEDFAAELAGNYDVVAFITIHVQVFSSLAVSRRLKEIDPSVKIVLGGLGIAFGIGPSILSEYPYIDYIIQGDGEWQFLDLLRKIEADRPDRHVEGKPSPQSPTDPVTVISDLKELPIPDYDEYPQLAEEFGSIDWSIPIEGSRGCWWDRVSRTGDPMNACRFCVQNGGTYREKSAERVAQEMEALSDRHSNVKFRFTDSVMRSKDVAKLAKAIKNLGKRFVFFHEIRASIHPYDLMLLWEAGCREVQMGIEGLSSSYLRRIGKGTTTIQNLQAIKTCFELGIYAYSNLVTHFPGATETEVEETAQNILDYAIAYQPLFISKFILEPNSCVYKLPDKFGVSNIRNAEMYKAALPEDVWERLRLHYLDYDYSGEVADWGKVEAALEQCHDLHRRIRQGYGQKLHFTDYFFTMAPLYYEDRSIYLDVIDRRNGFRQIELDEQWREVYLYCMEIRSTRNVVEHFSDRYDEEEIKEMLDAFVAEKLMFAERGKCLSLAVATYPHIAAERIRKARDVSESGTD